MDVMVDKFLTQMVSDLGNSVPSLIGALLMLLLGWLVAKMISGIIGKLLHKTTIDNKISKSLLAKHVPVEDLVSKGLYYFIMLFVLVGFFQALGLTMIAGPLTEFINQITQYAPRILGAAALLIAAWAIATILKSIVSGLISTLGIDEKLSSKSGVEDLKISHNIGEVVYWLVFLFFLPGILGALALESLLAPFQSMLNKGMEFLPNIFAAAILLGVGWFMARIIERIVTNLLAALGVDAISKKVKLDHALGKKKLSGIIGMLVYILIMIPVVIAGLDALSLDALTTPASNMLNTILLSIPMIFSAILLLAISYVIGQVAAEWTSNILSGIGFDLILKKLGITQKANEGVKTPSQIAGYLVFIGVMIFASIEAFNQLGLVVMADLVREFLVFGSQVLLGLIILSMGIFFANLASKTIQESGTPDSHLFSSIAKAAILLLSGAMALNRMGLANDIINMAFGLLLGSIAVAVALSFGLGGRDIAAKSLEKWMKSRSKN